MSLLYFDTSALLKKYRSEKGSHVIDELIERKQPGEVLVSSLVTAVEVFSVAARMLKGKVVAQKEYDLLTSRFLRDFTSQFQVGAVDNALVAAAINTATEHRLRTVDAIHYAAILRTKEVATRVAEPLVVVTSDKEMIQACRKDNIEVLNPEAEGALEVLKTFRV